MIRSSIVASLLVFGLMAGIGDQAYGQSKASPAAASGSAADKKKAGAMFKQAFDLWQAGEFDAAALLFEGGLKIDSGNGTAHFYLGETYSKLNKIAEAKDHYQKAVDLAGGTKEAVLARARLVKFPYVMIGTWCSDGREGAPENKDAWSISGDLLHGYKSRDVKYDIDADGMLHLSDRDGPALYQYWLEASADGGVIVLKYFAVNDNIKIMATDKSRKVYKRCL